MRDFDSSLVVRNGTVRRGRRNARHSSPRVFHHLGRPLHASNTRRSRRNHAALSGFSIVSRGKRARQKKNVFGAFSRGEPTRMRSRRCVILQVNLFRFFRRARVRCTEKRPFGRHWRRTGKAGEPFAQILRDWQLAEFARAHEERQRPQTISQQGLSRGKLRLFKGDLSQPRIDLRHQRIVRGREKANESTPGLVLVVHNAENFLHGVQKDCFRDGLYACWREP